MSTQALWYLSRGTGMAAFTMLSLALILGIASRRPAGLLGLPRFAVAALHRNVSLLLVAFVGVHVVTTVLDPYAGLRAINAVIPFTSAYRPVWVGLGAVALDLAAAVIATSLLRARVGFGAWRVIHWSVYAIWPITVIHALGTGSDVRSGLLLMVGSVSVALVIAVTAGRVVGAQISSRARAAWLVGGAAAIAIIGAWTMSGPLRSDWSQVASIALRAGS